MNRKLPGILAVATLLCAQTGIRAQTTNQLPTRLQISVGDVTDNRTTGTFNSECKVELKFTGDATMEARSVRQIRVTEATDDAGHDLVPKDENDFHSHSLEVEHSGGALEGEVSLRNPARSATVIKILKGEVELYNPTEANGGLLTITNVLQNPAEPIANPVLDKYGIQLMYLTKESYEAKKKELEAQEKAAADAAAEKLTEAKWGSAFAQVFKGMFGEMMSNSKNSIQMYIKDPDKRIVDLKFIDGQGKPLTTHERWSSGDFQSTGLEEPPPPDTQMIIQLATPESLKSYPFMLENIPLP